MSLLVPSNGTPNGTPYGTPSITPNPSPNSKPSVSLNDQMASLNLDDSKEATMQQTAQKLQQVTHLLGKSQRQLNQLGLNPSELENRRVQLMDLLK